jgi:DNA-directed RNA polymerase specialized sigma24 family protein
MKALLALRRPLTPLEKELAKVLFEDVFAAHGRDVWNTLARWDVPLDLRPDMTQETFERAFASAGAAGFPDSVLAKLRGLAKGLAWNYHDREQHSPITGAGAPSSSSEKPAGSVPSPDLVLDLDEVARKLFHLLSPDHQAVVDAIFFKNLTREEASLALGISEANVKKRLEAAIRRLRVLALTELSESERGLV